MVKVLIVFFVMFFFTVNGLFGQHVYYQKTRFCEIPLNFDSCRACPANLDSSRLTLLNFITKNPINQDIFFAVLKRQMQRQKQLRYVFLEESPSFAYLLNSYLNRGDSFLLKAFEPYEQEYLFFSLLRTEWLQDSLLRKIVFVGTDLEYDPEETYVAVRDILFRSRHLETNHPELKKLRAWMGDIPNPRDWNKRALSEILNELSEIWDSEDSLVLARVTGPDYRSLVGILKAYRLARFPGNKRTQIALKCQYTRETISQTLRAQDCSAIGLYRFLTVKNMRKLPASFTASLLRFNLFQLHFSYERNRKIGYGIFRPSTKSYFKHLKPGELYFIGTYSAILYKE